MCRKRHNINKTFQRSGVYYPSRQIYILTKKNTLFLGFNINSQKIEKAFPDTKKNWKLAAENFSKNIHTGVVFNLDKIEYHSNAKELLVERFSLKTFVKVSDAH